MVMSALTDVKAELLLAGVWTNVTSDVREPGFDISRGRADEAGRAAPSRCGFTLDNRSGVYSPRNPTGAYYGQLIRNTPFRLSVPNCADTFARTTANGWGASSSGLAWTTSGGLAANYSTDTTYGKISNATLDVGRSVYHVAPADTVQYCTFRTSAQATGVGYIGAGLIARADPTNDYYYLALASLNTTATGFDIDLTIFSYTAAGGAQTVVSNVSTGLTYTASTDYGFRFECIGSQLKARVWAAAGTEPSTWLCEADSHAVTAPGRAGVYSTLSAGITNALPVTVSFDNYECREVRFGGEVPSWPLRWDKTGEDVWVPAEAYGVLRRLNQNSTTIESQLKRYFSSLSHVAYWPLEDSSGSNSSFASADSNGVPMAIGGSITADYFDTLNGSLPLPKLDTGATFAGKVTMSSTATAWTIGCAFYTAGQAGAETPILQWFTNGGTPYEWRILLKSTGDVKLQGYDVDATALAAFNIEYTYTNAITGLTLNGEWTMFEVKATQNGANIDYSISNHYVSGLSGGSSASDAGTMKPIRSAVLYSLGAGLTGCGLGHVIVTDNGDGLGDLSDYMGSTGETAGNRLIRLCDEAGIPVQIIGEGDVSAEMGIQRAANLVDLLQDCADVDGGILSDQRGVVGIRYITSRAIGNQTPVSLAYSTDLYDQLEPTEDDQRLRNDVTVSRYRGSSHREVQATGSLGTDTVGQYAESATVSVLTDFQLRSQAVWRLNLGTYDVARYPQIGVHLGRSAFSGNESKIRSVTNLDCGDRLAITGPPAWLPPDDIEQIIQGYREVIARDGQRITWNCSPAGPWRLFVLSDTDATYGRLAYSGVTLNEDLTTTETGADVAIATGDALITTTAGDMPYDIVIGGERMTVTACSGVASPQTLTVTRSVNSVVKTHLTGAEVQLWLPAFLSLE